MPYSPHPGSPFYLQVKTVYLDPKLIYKMHAFSVLRSKWYAGAGINGDMRVNFIEFNAWEFLTRSFTCVGVHQMLHVELFKNLQIYLVLEHC